MYKRILRVAGIVILLVPLVLALALILVVVAAVVLGILTAVREMDVRLLVQVAILILLAALVGQGVVNWKRHRR